MDVEVRHSLMRPLDVGIDCSAAAQLKLHQKLGIDGVVCAEQQHKDDCDINVIVKRHGTAALNVPAEVQQVFMECIDVSYQEAMNVTIAAREAFMELPADLRKRFDNDPGKLLSFVGDRANFDEAVKLGIAKAPDPVPPAPAPAVSTTTAPGGTTPPTSPSK